MATQNRYITLGGHRHRYTEHGKGPHTLLLVHGISSSLDFYEQVIPLLSDSFHILAIDLLGFGLSDKPAGKDYTLELYASLLGEFARKTTAPHDPLTGIGHSMGGKYLLALALQEPTLFSNIVLSNTDGFIHIPKAARAISLPGVRHILKRKLTEEKAARKMFSHAFHAPEKVDRESFEKNLLTARDKAAFDTVMALNRNLLKLDLQRSPLKKRLKELSIPVLVIWGAQDRFLRPSTAQAVKQAIPHAQIAIFDECGHCPMLEHPEKFTKAVESFLLAEPQDRHYRCSSPSKA